MSLYEKVTSFYEIRTYNTNCSQLDRILLIVASYMLFQFKGKWMQITATQMIVHHSINFTPI